MTFKKWIKLSEKTIFENSHWKYNLDKFSIEGVGESEYHYVHTLGSTMVIPITNKSKIVLVKQFRYLNQKDGLEFPCGSVEQNLSLIENAQKELREETGYSSSSLIEVGAFSPYTGASDEVCTVFIGTELSYSPLPKDETEEFEVLHFSFDEVDQMIKSNEIWDGLTLSAWVISQNYISKLLGK